MTHPIASVSEDLFILTQDTSNQVIIPTITIDTNTLRTISINYPWREGMPYQLEVLPGAVTDIYGLSLTDTLKQRLIGASKKDYGILNLAIREMKADTNYVVDLLSGGGNTLLERIIISEQTDYSQAFQSLPPGKYQIQLTVDLNKNGRWDTGNYDLKLQPEPFFIIDVEQLRANWEIDSNISLNGLLNN